MIGKQGKGSAWVPVIGVALIAMLGLFAYFGWAFMTANEPSATPTGNQVAAQSVNLNAGKAATAKVRAYNRINDSQPQVAPSVYILEKVGDQERLIADGTSLSATADTSVATTVGAHLYGVAFSSTYYGVPKEIDVSAEVMPFYLDVYEAAGTAAGNINITTYKDSANAIGNITLAAGQTDTWDKIRVKENTANRAFNFKGLAFNLTSASNVQDIRISGMERSAAPTRLATTSSAEYFFVVPEAKLLKSWDVFETGVVQFQAVAGTNPNEGFDILAVDDGYYRSVDRMHIKHGVEDDAPSPADVGQGDVRYTGAVI